MKLAVSVDSPKMEARFERRFGRCACFLVLDTETRKGETYCNPAADASGGAGTQAAQFLITQGVGAVVSGDFGPNAFIALEAAGIKMYLAQAGQALALVDDFLAGRLEQVTDSTGPQRHAGGRSHSGRRQ